MKELTVNDKITDSKVLLIGNDGKQYGVVDIQEARAIAMRHGLDLCKVSPPNIEPATCKLMDYGKYRYEQQKKEKDARKNQKIIEIKEVRLSVTIDVGDIKRLATQAQKFISEGNKVKASIRLRGRQQAHPEPAVETVNNFIQLVGENIAVEKQPTQEGRVIYTIIGPIGKK